MLYCKGYNFHHTTLLSRKPLSTAKHVISSCVLILNICILSQWTNLEKYHKVQQLFSISVTHLSEFFYMDFWMFKCHNNLNESMLVLCVQHGHFVCYLTYIVCYLTSFFLLFCNLIFRGQSCFCSFCSFSFFSLVFKGKMCTLQTLNYVKIHHLEPWLADCKRQLSIFGRKDQINLTNHSFGQLI